MSVCVCHKTCISKDSNLCGVVKGKARRALDVVVSSVAKGVVLANDNLNRISALVLFPPDHYSDCVQIGCFPEA